MFSFSFFFFHFYFTFFFKSINTKQKRVLYVSQMKTLIAKYFSKCKIIWKMLEFQMFIHEKDMCNVHMIFMPETDSLIFKTLHWEKWHYQIWVNQCFQFFMKLFASYMMIQWFQVLNTWNTQFVEIPSWMNQ